jgi:ubiquinone biosynthesis protein
MSSKRAPRSIQIAVAFIGFGWAWLRLRNRAPEQLPDHLRQTLEGLGTTFIKLGQGLSLRRDLLPDPYREALDGLQSNVPPFASQQAILTIESAFGQPIRDLFIEFEPVPFAAASVAQVHKARMPNGQEVAVKVRRPAIAEAIKADLRLLRRFTRTTQLFLPALRRQRPLELIDELTVFLRDEIDFSHEARNMRRVANAFDGSVVVTMPHVIEPLATQEVLVQEFSHGRPLAGIYGRPRAREIVDIVLTAYIRFPCRPASGQPVRPRRWPGLFPRFRVHRLPRSRIAHGFGTDDRIHRLRRYCGRSGCGRGHGLHRWSDRPP